MKIKQIHLIWYVLGFLSVLFALNYVGVIDLSNIFSYLPTGFTVLSLSKVNLYSSSEFWSGPTWVLTVTTGGYGQYAIGGYASFDPEDLKLSNGTMPEHDLKIEVVSERQACEYPISYDPSEIKVWKLDMKAYSWDQTFLKSDDEIRQMCYSDTGTEAVLKIFHDGWDTYCVYKSKLLGIPGHLPASANVLTEVDVKVTSQGVSYEGTISNKEEQDLILGDNVAVRMLGGLKTYDNCPDTEDYMAMYNSETGNWKLTDESEYDKYVNAFMDLEATPETDIDQIKLLFGKVNYYADTATKTKSMFIIDADGNEKPAYESLSGRLENGLVYVSMDKRILIPELVFFVKASWLGIVTPVAKPQLIPPCEAIIEAGKKGTLLINLQNIGDEEGNIDVWVSCPPPFSVVTGTQTITLEKGETGFVRFELTGVSNEPEFGECTVYAKAIGGKDEMKCSVTLKPIMVCMPHHRRCEGDILYICNEYGSFEQSINCKAEGKICGLNEYGVLDCISPTQPRCKTEGETVGLFEECCEGLVEKDGVCVLPEGQNTCNDGTLAGQCSEVSEGMRCIRDVDGTLVLKYDITCLKEEAEIKQPSEFEISEDYLIIGVAIVIAVAIIYYGLQTPTGGRRRR